MENCNCLIDTLIHKTDVETIHLFESGVLSAFLSDWTSSSNP